MRQGPDRREFLGLALAAAGCSSLGWSSRALSGPAVTALQQRMLASQVTLISGAGGNVVSLSGADGVIMVDGGNAAGSAALLSLVRAGGRKVQALINTHWHWDHTGSNETLGKAGTRIIAHENTRLWMQRPIIIPWENRTYPAVPKQALPTSTFYTQDALSFGSHDIRYGYLAQAHTDGDLYVHLPNSNVLIVGDVVTSGAYPTSDYVTGGWIGGTLDATKELLKLTDANTLIVPGRGPVVDRAHLQAESDMLEVLKERLWQLMRKGYSDLDIVAAQPTPEYDARWGDPRQFLLNTYKGLWGHVRELRGVV